MKHLLLIAVLLILFVPAVSAQDEPLCDTEAATLALQTALDSLDSADDPLEVITEARRELARIEAECLGLGPLEGSDNTVTNSIEIPAGVYRVTAVTESIFLMQGTVLNGECDEYFSMLEMEPQAPDYSTQAVFESDGCTIIFEITANADYTISFEKLD